MPNAGLRWRITPQLALTAAYNGAGSFTRTWRVCGTPGLTSPACNSSYAELEATTARMPDAYRAGISFAATERLHLVAESVRRKWSRLPDSGFSVFGERRDTWYEDTTELHAGAEYKLPATPVVLRAGWWRDPGHSNSWLDVIAQSVTHHTFGVGVNLRSARLDFAYDRASLRMQRRAVVGLTFGL